MTRIAGPRDEEPAAGDIDSSRTLEAVRRELGMRLALVLRQRDRPPRASWRHAGRTRRGTPCG